MNHILPNTLSLHGVGTYFTLVYAYQTSDTADPWKLFDLAAPGYVNDLTELAPGWGYWVKVNVAHTLGGGLLAEQDNDESGWRRSCQQSTT